MVFLFLSLQIQRKQSTGKQIKLQMKSTTRLVDMLNKELTPLTLIREQKMLMEDRSPSTIVLKH